MIHVIVSNVGGAFNDFPTARDGSNDWFPFWCLLIVVVCRSWLR